MNTYFSIKSTLKEFGLRLYRGRSLENVDYVIPYEIDEDLVGRYSTKNFTGLYFPKPPGEFEVLRAYNFSLRHRDLRYIQFIDGLYKQALPHNKLRFLYWVREHMQLYVADMKFIGWMYSTGSNSRIKSILKHVDLRIQNHIANDLAVKIQYQLVNDKSEKAGNVQKLVEIGLQIKDVLLFEQSIKSERDFVIWFGKSMGIDISGSFTTTKQRINARTSLDEFVGHEFARKSIEKRNLISGLPETGGIKRKAKK
ncbi:MAG: hypothetical protein IM574_03415 [Cytophagales bacterium]|jgi:hypothetical protein|nr:hypothetical protein [Cytophagales bacterium]MCA6390753.1 hypothetical protein [Cytophagales bacterium]MCA6403919.1 hypothetical protein [Cytophagales bacterium]MCA6405831.1 hypothetical protein [Cytophagales bacterium]MCA6408869.1 hypothetical protein [Cytophagales bacterium]